MSFSRWLTILLLFILIFFLGSTVGSGWEGEAKRNMMHGREGAV